MPITIAYRLINNNLYMSQDVWQALQQRPSAAVFSVVADELTNTTQRLSGLMPLLRQVGGPRWCWCPQTQRPPISKVPTKGLEKNLRSRSRMERKKIICKTWWHRKRAPWIREDKF